MTSCLSKPVGAARLPRYSAPGLALAIFLAIVLAPGPVQAALSFHGKVTHVTDGDTLWVAPDDGGAPRKLRLDGLDAPEICQAGGLSARDSLAAQVLHQQVKVTVRSHDGFGRGLAKLKLGGQDVGARLVRQGHAWSHRYQGRTGPYAKQEALARQEQLGLFAHAQPEEPRAFRQRHGSCHS